MAGCMGTRGAFHSIAWVLAVATVLALNIENVEANTQHINSHKHRPKISTVQKKHHGRKTKALRSRKNDATAKAMLVHGVFAEYNSLGYQQIKVDRTGRMLKVSGWTQTSEQLTKALGEGRNRFVREINGDFAVKMIRSERPGEATEVKIVDARNLVVMNQGRIEFRAPTAQAAANAEPRIRAQNSRFGAGDRPIAGPQLAPEYQSVNARL